MRPIAGLPWTSPHDPAHVSPLQGRWLRLQVLAIAAILGTGPLGVVRVHGLITFTETSHWFRLVLNHRSTNDDYLSVSFPHSLN